MTYSIRESNQDDKDLIYSFNKELEDHGISFRLPISDSKSLRTEDFIFASSNVLSDKLISNIELREHIHLTRGDGDGPINL